jgi:hypothetical protein
MSLGKKNKQLRYRVLELEKENSLLKVINQQAYDLVHNNSIHQHRDNQRNRRLKTA